MPSGSRKTLNISIVGAGRVGSALAFAFRTRGHKIVSVISRTPSSASRLARVVRCTLSSASIGDLSPATTCLVLATPDEQIEPTAAAIASLPHLEFQRVAVFHTSGSLTSDILFPLEVRGARIFALHPIQTFPRIRKDKPEDISGIWYGYEGPAKNRAYGRGIARELRGKILFIPKEKKILYHIACVFASNYPTIVLGAAESLAREAGLQSLKPLQPLIERSVRNTGEFGPMAALTGPLARGSASILQKHLEEMGNRRPDLLDMYVSLATFGLTMARSKGTISEEDENRLREILKKLNDH